MQSVDRTFTLVFEDKTFELYTHQSLDITDTKQMLPTDAVIGMINDLPDDTDIFVVKDNQVIGYVYIGYTLNRTYGFNYDCDSIVRNIMEKWYNIDHETANIWMKPISRTKSARYNF